MSTGVAEEDSTFASLPRRIRERIDRAFELAADESLAAKRRKDANEVLAEGGFIVHAEQSNDHGGFVPEGGFIADVSESSGGFISGPSTSEPIVPDSYPNEPSSISHITLAQIPTALQILDLPPGDEQVLDVFRSAASGWTNSRSLRTREGVGAELVSRKDWRAVCSVLLAPQGDGRLAEFDASDELDSGEEYIVSDQNGIDSNLEEDDIEDEDYSEAQTLQGSKSRKKMRRTRGRAPPELPEINMSSTHRMTSRRKAASREAFSLFLPDIADSQLDSQQITVPDLLRISKELKETLSYDQIVEMVSSISTSKNKLSVSLDDFEKMMFEAKMV